MDRRDAGLLQAIARSFPLPMPMAAWGIHRADIPLGCPIFCIDRYPGRGVDLVSSLEHLPMPDRSVGTLLLGDSLTRVRHFWHGLAQVRRVLHPAGMVIIQTPLCQRVRTEPADLWRFTPEALDMLLEDFPQRILGWHGPAKRPHKVWALAFGRQYNPLSAAQLAHFHRVLARCSRRERRATRRMRAGLVRLIGGRRAAEALLACQEFGFDYRGFDYASALAA